MVHIYVHQTSIFFDNIVCEFLHMICGLMLFSNYLLKWFSLLFTMNTSNSHICIYIFYHVTNHSSYDLCANESQSDTFVKFFIWLWDQRHCLSSTIFAVYTFFLFCFWFNIHHVTFVVNDWFGFKIDFNFFFILI